MRPLAHRRGVRQPGAAEPVRVLFLQTTHETASEYDVHRLLAENVDPLRVDCHFVGQSHAPAAARHHSPTLDRPGRVVLHDFGRDSSIEPRPSRVRRALMMARRLPSGLGLLARQIREVRPHAVYSAQHHYDVFLGELLAIVFGLVQVIHLSYPMPWLGPQTRRAIRRSRHLVACSEFVREGAIADGVDAGRITTLLHPADLRQYQVAGDRAGLRREFGWPEAALVAIAAARLDPTKGHLPLIDAFAQAHREEPRARLLLCGQPHHARGHGDVIARRVGELGLRDRVAFAGFRGDLPALLAASDVFALPTENDALPLVFLAAMAASLPVVAVRSGGVPEIVTAGETGLLSAVGDTGALAADLLRLLCDRDLALRMGAAGRRRAFEVFDPQRVAARWQERLEECVAVRAPAGSLSALW